MNPVPVILCFFLAVATARSASITVEFKPDEGVTPDYHMVNVYLLNDNAGGLWEEAIKWSTEKPAFQKTFDDLDPAEWWVMVFTGSFDEIDTARPGAYWERESFSLTNHNSQAAYSLKYQPLGDLDFFKGEETRTGKIVDHDGKPVVNFELKIQAYFKSRRGHGFTIARPKTGNDGLFQVAHVARGIRLGIRDADGRFYGTLDENQTTRVTVPPGVGSAAPNISFADLATGQQRQLSAFAGKVVVLDFWASWCGPCQSAMDTMQTFGEVDPAWGDRVRWLAISIDDKIETARGHVKKKRWHKTDNAWAGEGGWKSAPIQALEINSIPQAYVIDQQGRIVAMGNPRGLKIPAVVARLLANELP